MTDKRALNLDELFGQGKTVKVLHEGREYEFMLPDAMGPRQAVQIQKMQQKAQALQALGENINEEQSEQIEKVLESMIKTLCADFPVEEITFMKKMRIVTFYMEETQVKKKVEKTLKTLTGRKPSRK